jgi:hypothetical protein
MSLCGADASRLPSPVARVDRDQPWFAPEVHPESIRADPDPWGFCNPVAGADLWLYAARWYSWTGLGAAIVIGTLAGLLPAIRAARLSPTQALWSV